MFPGACVRGTVNRLLNSVVLETHALNQAGAKIQSLCEASV